MKATQASPKLLLKHQTCDASLGHPCLLVQPSPQKATAENWFVTPDSMHSEQYLSSEVVCHQAQAWTVSREATGYTCAKKIPTELTLLPIL